MQERANVHPKAPVTAGRSVKGALHTSPEEGRVRPCYSTRPRSRVTSNAAGSTPSSGVLAKALEVQSRRITRNSELFTCKPPLYLMNPSLRNLFMKKLTRLRVVPIMPASVFWDILATIFSVASSLPYLATSNSARQPLFAGKNVGHKNVRKFPLFVNHSHHFCFFYFQHYRGDHSGGGGNSHRCPAMDPSPKNSRSSSSATTASLPEEDATVIFTRPCWMYSTE
jgi:hypothetical protein